MRLKLSPTFKLYVDGAKHPFLVDRALISKINKYSWKFVKRYERAWAVIRRGQPRVFLHHFVVRLHKKKWVEVYHDNLDRYDCRFVNLRPYDRSEDGARRKTFKNKKSKHKGVTVLNSGKLRYKAEIRYRGKKHYLGVFRTADEAANEYAKAYKVFHNKQP